jgi:ribosome-associated protein
MNRTTPTPKIVTVLKQGVQQNADDETLESTTESLYDGPSKSQRKRDMTALQKLGVELVELPRDKLERVDLPENLMDAIKQAQNITDHEGKRRQLQYVGKLMRNVDAEPIRATIDGWKGASKAETAALHALERWRERLLGDDEALVKLTTLHPAALNPDTLRELRTAIRMARKEQKEHKPPKHFRELFQILKSILQDD